MTEDCEEETHEETQEDILIGRFVEAFEDLAFYEAIEAVGDAINEVLP